MDKNDKFTMDDIEPVTVNGMNMFKVGSHLCLDKPSAIRKVRELNESNLEALVIPFDPDFDVIDFVKNGGVLHVIKLG